MTATVLDLFYQQLARAPQQLALIGHNHSLSYQELDSLSSTVANVLISNGINQHSYVPLIADRSPYLIVGILAILKTGAAYIPIDRNYPEKRIQHIIEQSHSPVLLTTRKLASQLINNHTNKVITLDKISIDNNNPATLFTSSLQQPAYVIFTSGTTGVPKGVIIEHHALQNIIVWHNQVFEVTADSRSTLIAGIGFDVAQWEIWSALTSGSTLYLPDDETRVDAAALLAFFTQHQITHAFIPTVLVPEVVRQPQPATLALRYLFTAGEKLNPVNTDALSYPLIDYYGPTEATIFTTVNRVVSASQNPSSSIGLPVADTEVFILDETLAEIAHGEIGELMIAGPCLARGYLHNPQLTEQKFVFHPQQPGKRLYHSGDLARWLPDGSIQFLGRRDDQIKIRGNRVELGEIETLILRQEGVQQVSAIATQPQNAADKQILAFLVTSDERPTVAALIEKIKSSLRSQLPDYFMPADYILLDKLPLNANGKTDKQALLTQYQGGNRPRVQERESYSQDESLIADIWQGLLGHSHFVRNDNFFNVGGHSLLAARLIKEIAAEFGVKTYIRDIYEHNTIAGLAATIGHRINGTTPTLDSEPIRALQEDVTLPADLVFQPHYDPAQLTAPRHILLTGATGFIGVHLLAELLSTTDATLHCLIRDQDRQRAEARLTAIIERYSVEITPVARARIRLYPGDLAEPQLGLAEEEYQRLAQTVDIVYHSASAVNFIQPYSYMKRDNVQGLTEIVRFAAQQRTKPLILLSTISVYSWGHLHTGKRVMREDDSIDQNLPAVITDIGYVRSKWVMEKIADLAAEHGLPLMTFRLGYATFHSKTGVSASYQWWGRMVKTCITHGAIPDLQDLREGLTTVDYMTRAIAHISRNPQALGKKFNLIHSQKNNLTLKGFFQRLEQDFQMNFSVIPYQEWIAQWEQDSSAPLYPLLSLFKDNMYNGRSTVELYQDTYLWDCSNVAHFLTGSGIEEPRFAAGELQRYLQRSLGYTPMQQRQ